MIVNCLRSQIDLLHARRQAPCKSQLPGFLFLQYAEAALKPSKLSFGALRLNIPRLFERPSMALLNQLFCFHGGRPLPAVEPAIEQNQIRAQRFRAVVAHLAWN